MNVLVTGGAGFIGSNFIYHMLNKYDDYQIVNLDKLTYAGNLENLKQAEDNPNYKFIKGDITNRELVEYIFNEYDINYVVNFAAESHVDRSIEDPDIFVKTNVRGTQVLLDIAKKYWLDECYDQSVKSKFLQVSTDEVYGSLGEEGYFTEETPLAPNSPYSASKASADMMVRAYHETFNLPINITRCSNNYGPYQFPEKLIPLFLTNALNDKELPLYGDGQNVRDWLHVKDHCQAIDLVLHEGENGEVYNVGGNNEKSNIEITKAILNAIDKPESLITFVEDRLGHDRRYAIDPSKIREELGWEPEYTFETGIKETIQWYLDNKEWWKKVKSGKYQEYYKKMYAKR
ncbi:dTDP-glucose 4,6-dehydratase [Halobacteroides halobius DSM 5150]|uniref:dTDP-glucose 4,6-dehydratase n=1 Tax=Halobacteroides halobius (strain ATCC 35273 / DSM 5150 / MD-1) TaxID=748449 RepID=L0KAB7_HALHC|nr:dTDP-glucose 4,6-dehydratase [Halobacteroides halobius]AGB42252.1 dTDP-glucose 4,6-dehydratase [Halobacteroides halobius DSM 5150]